MSSISVQRPLAKKPRLDEGSPQELDQQAPVIDIPENTPLETNKSEKNLKRKGRRARKVEASLLLPEPCSPEDVLWQDIVEVLGADTIKQAMADRTDCEAPIAFKEEVTVEIKSISSGGDGIGLISPNTPTRPWCIIVPLSLPGELVRARVYRNARMYSYADLLEVITPNNALRDMSRVQCKYFGQCAGCQYQMLSYETQLKLKRDAIFKAYKNYSGLSQCDIPVINETIGSPLQYNYRTKITPHFEAPPKSARDDQGAKKGESPSWLKIGFNRIGTRKVMDIEDCPIATPTIRNALGPVREEIKKNIFNYKKGVSLLFRDSLDPGIEIERRPDSSVTNDTTDASASEAFNRHICITDHNAIVREKVGEDDWIFEYTAGSFFQNNNSVLGPLTRYVREATFAPWDVEQASIIGAPPPDKRPTHLVDAYCGCGLFSITLSPYFSRIAGIELSASSISAATRNLKLNHALHPKLLPDESRCQFLAGDASNIFDVVNGCQGEGFPADKTVLVIDPPRKGCDAKFIQQVIDWGCQTIVYVSCNVNTQARDVGMLMRGMEEMHKDTDHGCGKRRYVLESIRGFDLFPQTAHVECVAVLRLVESQ